MINNLNTHYLSPCLSTPRFSKSSLAFVVFLLLSVFGQLTAMGLPNFHKRTTALISESKGARQILCAFLALACQNTPLTKFLCNLKKKSFLGPKNAKAIPLGFLWILTKNFIS